MRVSSPAEEKRALWAKGPSSKKRVGLGIFFNVIFYFLFVFLVLIIEISYFSFSFRELLVYNFYLFSSWVIFTY